MAVFGSLNRSVIAPLSSAIITVLVAGLVVAGIDTVDRDNVEPGTARLEPSGVVEISLAGAPFVRASHGRTLRANDKVQVLDGRAVLELPDRSKVELRSGSVLTVNGAVQPEISLNDGDLLVESGKGDTVMVDGGTALIEVAGSSKLRRGVSLAAGVYEGTARVSRNDDGLTIPQYRQAAVVGTGILPPAAEPLSLAAADEWDRRMAGSVMALDEQLRLIAQAFEAEAPPDAGPDQFKEWMPKAASLPITPELLSGRAVGENLIGLTLVALDKGDFNARVASVFGFRAEGASWGLVAADRAINPNPVIQNLEFALAKLNPAALPSDLAAPSSGRGPNNSIDGRIFPIGIGVGGGLSGGGSGGTGGTGGPGGTGSSGTGGTGSNGTGGTGGSGGAGGGGTGGGGTGGGTPGGGGGSPKLIDLPPTGTFLDPLLDPLLTPVEDLLSGLLGGLLGQGSPTTGTAAPKPQAPVVQSPPVTATTPTPGSGTITGAVTATVTPTTTVTTAPPPPPATGTGGTTSGGLLGGLLGPTPTTTTTTTRPTTTTTSQSPGLLGGIVGGLTKTVGGLL
ncbi:MAG TPA: hypothetical protein VEG38_21035 [Acidimicrobiia bacterium]|nr:hypothetical protein [Acidimicrobiia bacterium]